jgi:uncharacterized spore protein YtfJ
MKDSLDRFLSLAKADVCFGDPIRVEEKTIIPAAEVMCGAGFGAGQGEGESDQEDGATGEGAGGGGGGFVRSRSVAVVVVSPEGVTVEPVVDATQIAMAGIAATAFVGYWLLRLMKSTGGDPPREKGPSLQGIKSLFK